MATARSTASSTAVFVSHAVSRTSELLSCAKAAVKAAQAREDRLPNPPPTSWSRDLLADDLRLCSSHPPLPHLEEPLTLLRTTETDLGYLEQLVKRRGTTNDPTVEISQRVESLGVTTQSLQALLVNLDRPYKKQRQRHYQCIQGWFRERQTQQKNRLQRILQVRGTVLQEQAKRRQRFQQTNKVRSKTQGLFVPPPPLPPKANGSNGGGGGSAHRPVVPTVPLPSTTGVTTNGTASRTNPPPTFVVPTSVKHTPQPSLYGNSGSYYTSGATGYGYGSSGMRNRRGGGASDGLQQEYQQRTDRLQEARQAEQSIAELGTVFGKMSTMIAQQSETLEKVEDDVEAAFADVSAGQEEITILYEIKKGNRPLILKTFALLNFLIIFMRFYAKNK